MKPSDRQIKAARLKIENLKNYKLTDYQILKKAGYSESSSRTSTTIMETPTFLALVEKHLPDSLLTKVHEEGLNATKVENKRVVEDYAVRHKYLDTAYKIKKKYPDPQAPIVNMDFKVIVLPELNEG